jgi:hypothetical protein
MPVVLAIVSILIAVVCYMNGWTLSPQSAPQQTVQELRLIHGAVWMAIAALCIIAGRLGTLGEALTRQAKPIVTVPPEKETAPIPTK